MIIAMALVICVLSAACLKLYFDYQWAMDGWRRATFFCEHYKRILKEHWIDENGL